LYSGSSAISGTNTTSVELLVTRSSPWSKNCPKNVIQELNGTVRPKSGFTLGMRLTNLSSVVPNKPSRPGLVAIVDPGLAAAAAMAAGLPAV
jgi:hypothetical protein